MSRFEFQNLLKGCRELCEQPVNVCDLNLGMLLKDMSPHGQYGSVQGLELDIDDAEVVWCYKNNVSIYPPLEIQNKVKELQNKTHRTIEEEKFIESNQPSIGRAFIEPKNRNVIHI